MTSYQANQIAQELRDALCVYDDFIGLYLYGSHACGIPHADSDIDIAALFQQNRDEDNNVILPAWRLERKNDVIIDFHAYTPDQLNLDRFYRDEVKKGVYYAR